MHRQLKSLVVLVLMPLLLIACGSEEGSDPHAGHDHGAESSAAGATAQAEQWTCSMHPNVIEDQPGQCPICGMDLVPVRQTTSGEGVVRIDPVTMQNVGVETAPVTRAALTRTIRTTGRFAAPETAEQVVTAKVDGWVERLMADYEGARIRKGQALLEIYSPDLVATQEEYLLALRNAARLEGTAGAADARRLVDATRRRLQYWDISEAQIDRLEESGTPQKTLTLYAPTGGTVTRKAVTQGQRIQAGAPLLTVTNLRTLWLMVDVYEQDLPWVDVGAPVELSLPYQPGETVTGRVDYLYDTLDPATRTVRARVIVPNPNGRLRPGMYATARVAGREASPALTIPAEALIRTGEEDVVVVALGDGRFRPVRVQTGLETGGRVQILDGLSGSERVVTRAQFLIDSEARLRSAVGAMGGGHAHGDGSSTDTDPTPRRMEQGMDAEDHSEMDHSEMDHGEMDHGEMDHGQMNHDSMNHDSMN